MFASRFAKFSCRWLEWLLCVYVAVFGILTLSPIALHQDCAIIKGVISLLIGITTDVVIIRYAIVSRDIGIKVIAAMLGLGVLTGFNDIPLSLRVINPERYYLGPYSMLVQFAGYLYAIQRRYVAAIAAQERLNVDLVNRLVEREVLTHKLTESEAELRAQQNRLLEFERTRTLAIERERLMHDMHDGLGSSLLTTLAAIEKEDMPQDVVAEALRACIEDLRLVIDSLEPTAHDLVTLLATIRYRLGQRLVSAGLKLIWEIDDLPELPWLEPPDALNVLRLMQEALVNVLKHANASSVRVATRKLGGVHVEIVIEDNGCGYDSKTIKSGRGILSQAKRAERLGGELKTVSILGKGTRLTLLLPINKDPIT